MTCQKQILLVLLMLQIASLCWARSRYAPPVWFSPSAELNNPEESEARDNNNNNMNEADVLDRFLPIPYKMNKEVQNDAHAGSVERRKKFLGDSNGLQGGHSLQGLWAMPGRR